ncbi:MAG: hypothetical protein E6J61_21945 [Deltaproteobacteria bacterium]|nr:MAG: hypothetical protein E6J61_21945 [Deltaproteobacteria bacterium]
MRLRLAILVASIAIGACTTTPPELLPPPFGPDTSSPQPARLFWPTGIAIDPGGKHLLVANANFDHAFAGGAIYSLDVNALLTQRGTVPFSAAFVRKGGAAMVGNYLGPLVLDPAGLNAYSGSRDTNRLNGVTLDPGTGALGCRAGSGTSPDCRSGILDLGRLVNLEGPYGIAFGTSTPIGAPGPLDSIFVSPLIPHLDDLSNGVAQLSSPVAVLNASDPSQLFFSALATDPVNGSGIGAGPIVFEDVRRELILGGCYIRFPASTQGGQLTSGKCLPGSGSNLLRFLELDAGPAGFSRIYDLGGDLRSNETVALELAPTDPTTGKRTLYAAMRNPDLIAEIILPSDPGLSPVVRRTSSVGPFPSQIHLLQRPPGTPTAPDLLAVTSGTLTIGQTTPALVAIFDPAQGRVVGQVERLGDTPFAMAQLPPKTGDTSAKLFVSVFASCRIAVVDVPYDHPWDVSIQALVGSCK